MTAMALEAHGRTCIVRFASLAVVGVVVILEALLMTTPALLVEQELDGVTPRFGDVMGGVAIRAHGRFRIVLFHDLRAMH